MFSKRVPVSIKDTNNTRTSQLCLTIEWQDAHIIRPCNKKVLVISLTDDYDPIFRYNLHLSEEDFQTLKSSHDLLVSFASFPQHIISYVDLCLPEDRNPQPKFSLIFTISDKPGSVTSEFQLDIVEANQLRHLTHLSLRFAAIDSAITLQLVACSRKLKKFEEKNSEHESTIREIACHLLSSNEKVEKQTETYKSKYDSLCSELADTESQVRYEDEQINDLLQELRRLKEERLGLQNQLAILEENFTAQLANCKQILAGKCQEVELLQRQRVVELKKRESKHAIELKKEKRKCLSQKSGSEHTPLCPVSAAAPKPLSSSPYLTQDTPINPVVNKADFDPENIDIDPKAVSAAFGDGA